MNFFDVSKKGLAKLIEHRGKFPLVCELFQNAIDTDATLIDIKLKKIPKRPYAYLTVTDNDPEGFKDLTHAYTLFAESEKKDDPTKGGRFNLGEKLVLALCKTATISTTKGTIEFDEETGRKHLRRRREVGSEFNAEIRMNRADYDEVCEKIHTLILPKNVKVFFNGRSLQRRVSVKSFEAPLATVRTDEEGNLIKTVRKTEVCLYNSLNGEGGWLYELGIPVVETSDKWSCDIRQKVPLNFNRDNVPVSYLKKLRALVLNEMAEQLSEDEVTEKWVDDALSSGDVEVGAVDTVLDKRFGEKRAIYDPSDKEANNRLVSRGYTVIPGRAFGKEAWNNIKQGETQPSGQIAPTPKPYSTDPNAGIARIVPYSEWTDGMKVVATLTEVLGSELMDVDVTVKYVDTKNRFQACYGDGKIDYNIQKIAEMRFNILSSEGLAWWLDLIIHEFGHQYSSNHLDESYFKALSKLGGKLGALMVKRGTEILERVGILI